VTVRVTGADAGSVMYCTLGVAVGANAVAPTGAVVPATAGAVAAAGWAFTDDELEK
jgi:hypothetical protein